MITDLNTMPGFVKHSVPGGVRIEHPISTVCAYCSGLPSVDVHTWPDDPRRRLREAKA